MADKFDPSMIGHIVEVTLTLSRHTGANYYDSAVKPVSVKTFAGRLAEYTDRSFTFEPVGNAAPTHESWPYKSQDVWPNNRYDISVRQFTPESPGSGTDD